MHAALSIHTFNVQWSEHWIVSYFWLFKILIRTFCFITFMTLWRTDSGFLFLSLQDKQSITCMYDTWDYVILGLKQYPDNSLHNDTKQPQDFGHKFLTINSALFLYRCSLIKKKLISFPLTVVEMTYLSMFYSFLVGLKFRTPSLPPGISCR